MYHKRPNDGLNATQRYHAKCDSITIRPLKADGEKLRSAAGLSITQFILKAVDAYIENEK